MADTNAFCFLGGLYIGGFGMMFIYWVYSAYKEHEERQAAKITTILDLTNDIWTDIKITKLIKNNS